MTRPLLAPDDVAAFVRRARQFAARSDSQVRELVARSGAAAAQHGSTGAPAQAELRDELHVRDEELAAACEELRAQLDTLSQTVALLEREHSKYIDLFTNAPDAYVVTNLQGTTYEANVAAGALFGAEPSSLVDRPLISFVARQDTRAFRALLRELAGGDGGSVTTREAALRMRPRGQPVFVAFLRASVVRSAHGAPVAIRWQLRRRDSALLEAGGRLADAELARLLVADLDAPLATILGWTRLLRSGELADDRERLEALGRIEDGATQQHAMLAELTELALAHDHSDGQGEEPEAVDVDVAATAQAALAARVAPAAVPSPSQRPAPAMITAPTHGAFVHTTAERVERLLALVLAHAFDARGDAGDSPARVRVETTDAEVVVHVSCEPKLAETRSGRVRLATVARLAEACGGRLALSPDASSLHVHLPRSRR